MTINQGISGFPFAGADVGGFFGNPEKDLLVRWYQTGIWYPFFRAHAHLDARRREPYLLGEPYTQISTAAIRLRYTLLPAWYTAFHTASQDGSPIIRPMFWTHPSEEAGFALEDQFFVGSTGLLVKPVTEQGKESVDIWIPDNEVYYDYFTYDVQKTNKGKYLTVSAPLEKVPVLLQGGHIIPRRDIPRRSSALMRFDDYTLVVSVSKDGNASGELYIDDGDTFEYEQDQYIHRRFTFSGNTLTSIDTVGRDTKSIKAGPWLKDMETVYVDKVIIVGAPKTWNQKEATVSSEGKQWTVKIQYHEAQGSRAAFAVVGRVGAKIGDDWSIKLA
jgi:alpha 1,3-glucosidase